MKRIITILSLGICLGLSAQTTTSGSISHDGGTRTYRLYVPASYDGTEEVPLVLNLHGLGSNSSQQLFYGEFRPIADTANFIILLPQGLPYSPISTNAHWNANFPLSQSNDIDFLSKLIDSISSEYMINPNRIYSTGMSNGGFMSITLAGQLSDKIAAVASVTGTMTGAQIPANTIIRPMPIMQIHGDLDPTVDYNGASNQFGSTLSVDSLLNYWIAHNNCDETPIITQVPNINTTDGCTAERFDYLNGDSGAEVVHYKITGGEHTWPGAIAQANTITNQDFNASLEIWKFFSKYEKSSLVSVSEFVEGNNWITLKSENPSLGILRLASLNATPYSISVISMAGEIVLSQENNSGESIVDLTHLSNGNYLINVTNNSQNAVLKIIKK